MAEKSEVEIMAEKDYESWAGLIHKVETIADERRALRQLLIAIIMQAGGEIRVSDVLFGAAEDPNNQFGWYQDKLNRQLVLWTEQRERC